MARVWQAAPAETGACAGMHRGVRGLACLAPQLAVRAVPPASACTAPDVGHLPVEEGPVGQGGCTGLHGIIQQAHRDVKRKERFPRAGHSKQHEQAGHPCTAPT